jgi:hypothetical protein
VYDVRYQDIVEFVKKQAKAVSQPVEVKKSAFGTSKKQDAGQKEKTKEEIEAENFEKYYLKEIEDKSTQEVNKNTEPVEVIDRKS